MAITFLRILSKQATIWVFSKVQFFLITNIKLLFQSESYSVSKVLGYGWHFLHVYKNERVLAKAGGFRLLNSKLHKKTVITGVHSIS